MLTFYLSMLETEEQRDKLERIYRKYYGLIYHEAFSITQDHAYAEDVVHETFLQLIRIIDNIRVDNQKELMSFLCVITHNRTVDYLRRTNRIQLTADEPILPAEEIDDPETVAINGIVYEKLIARLRSLDEMYRSPLSLKIQGYSIDEIANFLNLTPQTVKTRIFRARKMLAAVLNEETLQ